MPEASRVEGALMTVVEDIQSIKNTINDAIDKVETLLADTAEDEEWYNSLDETHSELQGAFAFVTEALDDAEEAEA